MGRTREAALTGTIAAITKYGVRKATMGDIAMLAGIAKATLYNHFRTRDDVYAAAVAAEVDAIARSATEAAAPGVTDFADALADAARLVGEHPAIRRVALDEAGVLAALAMIGDGAGWVSARAHIVAALDRAGYASTPAAIDLVARYLGSQLLTPSTAAERAATVKLIAAAVSAPVSDLEQSPEQTQADSAGTNN